MLDSHDVVDSECVDNFSDNVPMLKRRLSHAQKSIEFLQGSFLLFVLVRDRNLTISR